MVPAGEIDPRLALPFDEVGVRGVALVLLVGAVRLGFVVGVRGNDGPARGVLPGVQVR